MKTFIIALAVFIILPFQSVRAATPEEQARFLTAVRQAFDKQDTNAIFTFVCWEGVAVKDTDGLKKMLVSEITEMKVSDMTLVDPDPKVPDVWKDEDGIAYHLNLPVTKRLRVIFAPGGHFGSDMAPVGEEDGKLYLLGPIPIK